jgi:hypothetical protein
MREGLPVSGRSSNPWGCKGPHGRRLCSIIVVSWCVCVCMWSSWHKQAESNIKLSRDQALGRRFIEVDNMHRISSVVCTQRALPKPEVGDVQRVQVLSLHDTCLMDRNKNKGSRGSYSSPSMSATGFDWSCHWREGCCRQVRDCCLWPAACHRCCCKHRDLASESGQASPREQAAARLWCWGRSHSREAPCLYGWCCAAHSPSRCTAGTQ